MQDGDGVTSVLSYSRAQFSGTLHHLRSDLTKKRAKFRCGRELASTVQRPLCRTQHSAATERFQPGLAEPDGTHKRLLNRLAQPPARRMVQVLVVSQLGVLGEFDGGRPDIHYTWNARCPNLKRAQLGFGENDAFHAGDKFGKRADVYADGLTAQSASFHETRATTDMGIEYKLARLGERLDSRPSEDRREPGRVFVKAVR
jgi:hypothetical protein